MIKKIKQTKSEKVLIIFISLLAIFSFIFVFTIKNKCLFVKNNDPSKIFFENRNNIAILNAECGNVIIELYPDISPNTVKRFKKLIKEKKYDQVAFHRVIKNTLVQGGDLEFGRKNNLNYTYLGTGSSGLGLLNTEISRTFNFTKGTIGFARTNKKNTEDSQFFILLVDAPLFNEEYAPVGKVLYGLDVLKKIKYDEKSEYVLRPDFILKFRMLVD